jgi:hypothetical protein
MVSGDEQISEREGGGGESCSSSALARGGREGFISMRERVQYKHPGKRREVRSLFPPPGRV